MKIAVLGAGAMGTTMAHVAAKNNHEVYLWNWEGDLDPLVGIAQSGENKKYLPGFQLHSGVVPQKDLKIALQERDMVCFAIPTSAITSVFQASKPYVSQQSVLVDLSKGLDLHTSRLIPEIMKDFFSKNSSVVMSGPAVAFDIMKGYYTQMDLASESEDALHMVQEVFTCSTMGFQLTSDVIGVELAGAFKNVYAISLGLCDGLGYGLNTKAALLTHAMAEMANIVGAFGGKRETVYGLSGLGDLIGTALADKSRNRSFGEYLGRGLTVDEAINKVGKVVEGKDATTALITFAKQKNIEVPLANMVSSILLGGVPAQEALQIYLQIHS